MAKKSNWQTMADKEWRRVVKEVGCCEMCRSKDKQLHAHHIIKRVNLAYRHDVTNGLCLCAGCHTFASHSAHNDLTFLYKWMQENRPGVWAWFTRHTVKSEKVIGKSKISVYKPISIPHRGDEVEYMELKEMKL